MLTELRLTQRDHWTHRKRWFQDDYFDLFVWQDKHNGIVGFQLCYDRLGRERVISWDEEQGFGHFQIDDGEDSPHKNMTPVFSNDAKFSYDDVIPPFARASQHIEEAISDFVLEKLIQYMPSK